MSLERSTTSAEPSSAELAGTVPHRPSLWRQGDFMKLWTAQTISQFGDEITGIALPFVALQILDATPFEMGILGVVRFLPWIFFTLPAGVWVDRMRRRPILMGADICRAVLLATIPIGFLAGWLSIWQVYVVSFIAGTLEVFFDVAYQSYLPSLVHRDELVEGNSKLELSRAGSSVAGPTVAGFLIQAVSAPIAIFFDAVSYAVGVVFVSLIRRQEPMPEAHDPAEGKPPSMWQEARAGLGYVLGSPYLRNIAACTGTLNLFGNIGGVMALFYVVNILGLNAATVGLIFAIGNIGVILGALTGGRLAKRLGIGTVIIGTAALSGVALLAFPLAPQDDPFWVLVAGGILGGFTTVVYNVNQVGLRQAITPHGMMGRMNATMRLIVWGTIPIGALIGGILGATIGPYATLWVSAIGAFVGFLPVFFSPVRQLREIPAQAE
ncbi:MAG TPA: MFS transporter [Candidatus Limnocylindria bacterium]|nr:MFS transporter [Candidatus Limnocylindria bacterium]